VHAAVVLGAEPLGNMREKSKVNIVGDEWGEGGKASAKGVQNLEQGVEGVFGVFQAVFTLEAATVESNVPVGGVVNEL
jgi:hypothetical protein